MQFRDLRGTCYSQQDFQLLHDAGFGIEIQHYMNPNGLDSFDMLREPIQQHIRRFAGQVSMHGICFDMLYSSPDPLIRKVVLKRFMQTLSVAEYHNIDAIVLHSTGARHTVGTDAAAADWINRSVEFWRSFAVNIPDGMTIYLENADDPDPAIFGEMIRAIDLPNVRCCLDIGHANVYSDVSPLNWIRELGDAVEYVHLHDNNGEHDAHLPLGEGDMPMGSIVELLWEQLPQQVPIVLECEKAESILWLKERGFLDPQEG
ncbi:sugar phosphate isomerase/epimerase [Ruminococcaceae bacterium OttesenSCG-928-L11]|nr:sugar phosphate isomerase/epimerase [Ruminococcaceae bacterium OttesenSCG-928-L11]